MLAPSSPRWVAGTRCTIPLVAFPIFVHDGCFAYMNTTHSWDEMGIKVKVRVFLINKKNTVEYKNEISETDWPQVSHRAHTVKSAAWKNGVFGVSWNGTGNGQRLKTS